MTLLDFVCAGSQGHKVRSWKKAERLQTLSGSCGLTRSKPCVAEKVSSS